MDGATLQKKLYAGYAKAATRIGLPCSQYRPTSLTAGAIVSAALVQTLTASFNAQDFAYGKPNTYGKPLWYCVADGSQLTPGDYLVDPSGRIYFIAGMQPLLPILAVDCNRVVSFFRPQQQTSVGAASYGGNTIATQTPLVTTYPASVLQGTKGDKSMVNLPGDIRAPWWAVLLPNLPGSVNLRNGDIMVDENGKRYKISSAELTDLGWRMSAAETET